MADALGLTGAHINRTLNRLREDGVAAIENQRLSIRDFPRLDRPGRHARRADAPATSAGSHRAPAHRPRSIAGSARLRHIWRQTGSSRWEEDGDARPQRDRDLGAPEYRQDQRGRIFPALRASRWPIPTGSGASTASGSTGSSPIRKVCNASFDGDVSIRWYEDGTLNASYNCIDRHLAKRGDQTAILWEGDDPGEDRRVTYRELHESVCRLANALKARGRQEGRPGHDLPADDPRGGGGDARLRPHRRDPFGGVRRLLARQPRRAHRGLPLDRADHRRRGAARRPQGAAEAQRRHGAAAMPRRRDRHRRPAHRRRHRLGGRAATTGITRSAPPPRPTARPRRCRPRTRSSSSTPRARPGKPKGVLHTTGGYLVYTSMTHEYVFDYRDGEIYWCTADVGWVTGHSYIVYGPLANGATTLMFEGVPNYPDPSRFWQVVDKHKVVDLLHRADRDPRADARGRGLCPQDQPQIAAPPRHGRRADQPRGVAVVLRPCRRRSAARSSTPGGRPRPAAS